MKCNVCLSQPTLNYIGNSCLYNGIVFRQEPVTVGREMLPSLFGGIICPVFAILHQNCDEDETRKYESAPELCGSMTDVT
eukprot:4305088-Amphidinium_carterae.1